MRLQISPVSPGKVSAEAIRFARASLLEQSDCVRCQAGGRVAHRVHSLWDGFKNPGCGPMDNPPVLHAWVGHSGLHGVLSRTIALRIVSILRNTAIRAAFGSTPRPSRRW